jgi:hypothetical protein
MFAGRTDLTREVGQLARWFMVIWIDRPRGVVFRPVQSAGVAVVSAPIVCAPVRSLAGVAVFAEFGADEEGIERVRGVDGFVVEY